MIYKENDIVIINEIRKSGLKSVQWLRYHDDPPLNSEESLLDKGKEGYILNCYGHYYRVRGQSGKGWYIYAKDIKPFKREKAKFRKLIIV